MMAPKVPVVPPADIDEEPGLRPRIAFVFTHRIQYFTNVLDELQRRGQVDVTAFYAYETSQIDDRGFDRRIEWDNRAGSCFREVILSRPFNGRHGRFFSSFTHEIFGRLGEFDPHIVHLNGYNNALQWLAWSWAAIHRVPLLARGDGDTLGKPSRSRWAPQSVLARLFASRLWHVFYQGSENRAFWLMRGVREDRLSWIPCVSDGELFRRQSFTEASERSEFRRSHGVGEKDVVFVVSGKLESRKRPCDAIEALARSEETGTRVWFLGSGPLADLLQSLAVRRGVADRVHWFGFRNQSEMPAILQAADVLLHPSEEDPWPYSVLEGAICGCALLLSDKVGSHTDWVQDAGTGLTFQCGDVSDLAKRMDSMIRQEESRVAFRAAAVRAAARYTESEFCDRFERVVHSLLRVRHAKVG
jgi:glycosyltransferase involved in cell wall biosynthesis